MDRLKNEVGEGLTTNRYVRFQYLIGFMATSMIESAGIDPSHKQYIRSRVLLNTS
jgi:hypothetical protein